MFDHWMLFTELAVDELLALPAVEGDPGHVAAVRRNQNLETQDKVQPKTKEFGGHWTVLFLKGTS